MDNNPVELYDERIEHSSSLVVSVPECLKSMLRISLQCEVHPRRCSEDR